MRLKLNCIEKVIQQCHVHSSSTGAISAYKHYYYSYY